MEAFFQLFLSVAVGFLCTKIYKWSIFQFVDSQKDSQRIDFVVTIGLYIRTAGTDGMAMRSARRPELYQRRSRIRCEKGIKNSTAHLPKLWNLRFPFT